MLSANDIQNSNVLRRIQSLSPSLSGALRDVAEVILAAPQVVVGGNVSKVATESNTSESAVVRFAKKLGYKGFRELQINLAYELGSNEQHQEEEIVIQDNLEAVAEKAYRANLNALTQSWELLDMDSYAKVIEMLNRSQFIHILGQGTNWSTAIDLCYNLTKLGIHCTVNTDPYMQALAAATSNKFDTVLGISHTGANKDIIEALTLARQNGVDTIGLTARDDSPITRIAEVTLCTANKEFVFQGEPLTSRTSLMYLVDIIFMGVALRRGQNALYNLRQVQDALDVKRHPDVNNKI